MAYPAVLTTSLTSHETDAITGPIAGVVAGFVAFGMARWIATGLIFERAGIEPKE